MIIIAAFFLALIAAVISVIDLIHANGKGHSSWADLAMAIAIMLLTYPALKLG